MKFAIKWILPFFFMHSCVIAQLDLIPKKSIDQINDEHTFLSKFSFPNPNNAIVDSLINSDFNQFDTLSRIAFLVKHDSLYDSRFYELIKMLQIENTESLLLNLTLELSRYGNEAVVALDRISNDSHSFRYWRHVVRTLVLGYEFDDFIIKVRPDYGMHYGSNDIQQRSYFNMNGIFYNERGNLQNGLSKFISGYSYTNNKSKLHQIVLDIYKKGSVHPDYKYLIIQQIIKQETLNRNEGYLNDYLAILDDISENDALSILEFIDSNRPGNYYPKLFLDLLDHDNEIIVKRVLGASSNCWDANICPKVKDKLIRIFNGNSETLKFKTAFVLMHDYKYPLAYDYLMSVVDQNSNNERYTAISWLGDASNHGHPMSDRLNSVLSKQLYSNDDKIKRATIETYLTYSSPNVIEAIIPFVDYKLEFIAKEIVKKILDYENKSFTIEKLQVYIDSGKGGEKHKQILETLK